MQTVRKYSFLPKRRPPNLLGSLMRPMRKRKETAELSTEQLISLAEQSAKQAERKRIGELVTKARLDAGIQNRQDFAKKIVNPNTGKPFHINQVANWEKGIGEARRYFTQIEDATGKPRGWFELQLDPIGHVIQLADEVAEIKRLVEKIALKVL